MIQYPNTLITTEWLMPNLQEELLSLHQRWRHAAEQTDFHALAVDYLSLSGTLQVAKLPIFSQFTLSIAAIAKALADNSMQPSYIYMALSTSELLLHELHNYVQTGAYHHNLLKRHYDYVIRLLTEHGFERTEQQELKIQWHNTQHVNSETQIILLAASLQQAADDVDQDVGNVDVFRGIAHYIALPSFDKLSTLSSEQWDSLSTAWRFAVAKLLSENKNNTEILSQLQQIVHYCLSNALSVQEYLTAKLWYLSDLWFAELQTNTQPVPASYAYLLSNIDVLISAENQGSEPNALELNGLILDVYLHLKNLNISQQPAKEVLEQVKLGLQQNGVFFSRLLSKVEQLIYDFEQSQEALVILQELDRQLLQRGWNAFHVQFVQLIEDVSTCINTTSDEEKVQLHWEIESQLQQLYTDIFTTYQALGEKAEFSAHTLVAGEDDFMPEDGSVGVIDIQSHHETLDKIRSSIDQIKQDFKGYMQQHKTQALPTNDQFKAINSAFIKIGLPEMVKISPQYEQLFATLKQHDISYLPQNIIDAITASVVAVELFLDSLLQQFYHQGLLKIIEDNIALASRLLNDVIKSGGVPPDLRPQPAITDTTQLRYDDSGEVQPQHAADTTTDATLLFEHSESADVLKDVELDPIRQDGTSESSDMDVLLATDTIDELQVVSDKQKQEIQQEHKQEAEQEQHMNPAVAIKQQEPVAQPHIEVIEESPVVDDGSKAIAQQVDSEALQNIRSQLPDDVFDMDQDIREIFIEEAEEVLEQLEQYLPVWQRDQEDLETLAEIRRGFHTLKGSGRMVGAHSVGELAWSVENLLNQVLAQTLPVSETLVEFITQTKRLIPTLVSDFTAEQQPSIDPAVTMLQAQNLQSGLPINQGLAISTAQTTSSYEAATDRLVDEEVVDEQHTSSNLENDSFVNKEILDDQDSAIIEASTTESMVEKTEPLEETASAVSEQYSIPQPLSVYLENLQIPEDDTEMNEDMKEIFIEEAEEVLETINPLYKQWQKQPDDLSVLAEVRRGFHTLKGSGRMVGANRSAELAWSIENMLNRVLDHSIDTNPDIQLLVADVLAAYPDLLNSYENQLDYPDSLPLWVACAEMHSKNAMADFSYAQVKQKLYPDASDLMQLSDNDADVAETDDVDLTDEILISLKTANERLAEVAETEVLNSEDNQINEIFLEEAFELVDYIESFIAKHQGQDTIVVDDDFVRAFHTLRGASGSICLQAISDISTTVEHSLKRLQQYDETMNENHLQAITQSVQLIKKYIIDFQRTDTTHDTDQQVTGSESADSYQEVEALQVMFNELTEDEKAHEAPFSVADILSHEIDALLDAEWELEGHLAQTDNTQKSEYARQIVQQIEKMSLQVSGSKKFMTLLTALKAVYQRLADEPVQSEDEELINTLLAGQKQLTGLLDSIAGSMALRLDEEVIEQLHKFASVSAEDAQTQIASAEVKEGITDSRDSDTQNIPAAELQIEPITTDSELLSIFLEEAQEIDADIHQVFDEWKQSPTNIEPLKVLQRHLHTLKGGARMVGISSMGDVTHEAETIYEQFVSGILSPSDAWVRVMQDVQDMLSLQLDYVINNNQSFFIPGMAEQLHALLNKTQEPESFQVAVPVLDIEQEEQSAEIEVDQSPQSDETEEQVTEATQRFEQMVKDSWDGKLPDSETTTIFVQEASKLIAYNKQVLQSFRDNIKDTNIFESMQHNYHTIKGGARMLPSSSVSDLAYELEKISKGLYSRALPPKKIVMELIETCHQWLEEAMHLLAYQVNPPVPRQFITALQQFSEDPDSLTEIPEQSLQTYADVIAAYEEGEKSKVVLQDISEVPPMVGNFEQAQDKAILSNEMIRISAGLIETMINLSGEAAINRARIDMGVSSLTNTIEEMGVTVQRLADQLRRMETELEAQILSQIDEEELLHDEGFDPLEMDQYSSLNQLSKSLTESASDLLDIKTTMLDKTRDAEGLLLQLSRTQTELQDNLMNSRMVPFSRLVPRLQRIIRQTANELGKSVELTVINAEDEIDRTILERITSPLEHMIRNAVDHGIETPQVREQKGKNSTGKVVIEILREGSEVVINLSDDGRGIDVEAVRKKAVDKGLIESNDQSLSDVDVIQYIFNAGLTTTKKVTQISGRGVGMDIVQSEVRQLGGNVSVDLVEGGGSRFSMRVPLTVAISDALVVRVADRYYAIPLVQIDRVVRINPEPLLDFYRSDDTHFDIDGSSYRLRYLNELLLGGSLNQLTVTNNASLPVILVKNRTGQNIAIQVDEISGSRIEVVVKSLGRQLSHTSGISSATIMGDGSVMLILDLIALIRNSSTRAAATLKAALTTKPVQARSTVLVVDDSVTVRKVTSRLLERQGYNVQVAKDGIDAIEILQDLTPDLMLLDIEMPRMDGFEVATQIRHDPRLRDIPIIMITSRTGDKHRQRALEIGVNDYMGKPYQEAELIEKIQSLIGEEVNQHDI